MAQNYTINSFQSDHVGQSDLQNMENNFECLRSTFSGSSAPANAIAGKQWFDTTKKLLKIRNNANSAWLGVMTGTAAFKIWVYSNSAEDGWVIDSSVTDKMLSFKGGNIYTTGGATAGSFASSSHTLISSELAAHAHTASQVAHNHSFPGLSFRYGSSGSEGVYGSTVYGAGTYSVTTGTAMSSTAPGITVNNSTGGDNGHIHAADANVRPTAAVGTLQYMDI